MRRYQSGELGSEHRVPDAPFKTTWPELSLKRMIRYAAENGYDRITWDTGETSAERYDLSKHIDRIGYTKRADGKYNVDAALERQISFLSEDGVDIRNRTIWSVKRWPTKSKTVKAKFMTVTKETSRLN